MVSPPRVALLAACCHVRFIGSMPSRPPRSAGLGGNRSNAACHCSAVVRAVFLSSASFVTFGGGRATFTITSVKFNPAHQQT